MFDGETALLTLIYCLFYLFVLVDILSFFFGGKVVSRISIFKLGSCI